MQVQEASPSLGNVRDHRPVAESAGAIVALACRGDCSWQCSVATQAGFTPAQPCTTVYHVTLLTLAIGAGANTVICSVFAGFLFGDRGTVICGL